MCSFCEDFYVFLQKMTFKNAERLSNEVPENAGAELVPVKVAGVPVNGGAELVPEAVIV